MQKKYSLTGKSIYYSGRTLFQIKAGFSFGSIVKGEIGGYVEKEENLSQDGDAWVSGNAQVYGDAYVSGNAQVYGNARVSGNAYVSGNAWVSGNAHVYGNACVYGDAHVYGDARLEAKACFTRGWFIGGDDSGKISEISDDTGSTFWKKQYVLGDYEIKPVEEVPEVSLKGKTVSVTLDGKTYTAVIQ